MNIYSLEWQWEVEQPIKPKRQLGNVNEEQESNLFSDDQGSDDPDENLNSEFDQSLKQSRSGRSSSKEKYKKNRKKSASSQQLKILLER